MRSLMTRSLSLITLSASVLSARADLVFETEFNDTLETANRTIGLDDLGFAGSLTMGDVDTFSLFITPNEHQEAFFSFDVHWSEGGDFPSDVPPPDRWLVARMPVDDVFAQVGLEYSHATFFFGMYPTPAQVYYLQIYSSMLMPEPITFDPVPGSTITGHYRLSNIRGFNGTIISGTAVPEPSSVLLGLVLAGSGLWLKRRSRKGTR